MNNSVPPDGRVWSLDCFAYTLVLLNVNYLCYDVMNYDVYWTKNSAENLRFVGPSDVLTTSDKSLDCK